MYGLLPVVLIGGGIALAVTQMWILSAILIVMGIFGVWLIGQFARSS